MVESGPQHEAVIVIQWGVWEQTVPQLSRAIFAPKDDAKAVLGRSAGGARSTSHDPDPTMDLELSSTVGKDKLQRSRALPGPAFFRWLAVDSIAAEHILM